MVYNRNTREIFEATKTFVIPHPDTPQSHYLVHACLEGPEAGVYYRGKGCVPDGKDSVQVFLPKYIKNLAQDFTVTASAIGKAVATGVSDVDLETQSFTFFAEEGTRFFWVVHGMRQAIEAEPRTDNVQVQGDGPYRWISSQSIEK